MVLGLSLSVGSLSLFPRLVLLGTLVRKVDVIGVEGKQDLMASKLGKCSVLYFLLLLHNVQYVNDLEY